MVLYEWATANTAYNGTMMMIYVVIRRQWYNSANEETADTMGVGHVVEVDVGNRERGNLI